MTTVSNPNCQLKLHKMGNTSIPAQRIMQINKKNLQFQLKIKPNVISHFFSKGLYIQNFVQK